MRREQFVLSWEQFIESYGWPREEDAKYVAQLFFRAGQIAASKKVIDQLKER